MPTVQEWFCPKPNTIPQEAFSRWVSSSGVGSQPCRKPWPQQVFPYCLPTASFSKLRQNWRHGLRKISLDPRQFEIVLRVKSSEEPVLILSVIPAMSSTKFSFLWSSGSIFFLQKKQKKSPPALYRYFYPCKCLMVWGFLWWHERFF